LSGPSVIEPREIKAAYFNFQSFWVILAEANAITFGNTSFFLNMASFYKQLAADKACPQSSLSSSSSKFIKHSP
jgi:hypothetical protein